MKDVVVIEADKSEKNYWMDIWQYKDLFYILSWRDIKVRYKQTVIGAAWSILRPLLTMIVFTVVFGYIAKLPSIGETPYPIMVYSGMLPWLFFSNALTDASNSLLVNSNLVSKIYFPRIIIPTSTIIVSFIDFFISFVLFACFLIYFQFLPSWKIIFLPFFILLLFITVLGVGLFTASLNVKYRDFRYVIPFIVQFGLYISPVGFNSDVIADRWKLIYSLNPLVGIIDGFRWAIIGRGYNLFLPGFFISIFIVLGCFILGLWYFRRTERKLADII